VEPNLSDQGCEAFRQAASAYFSERYMGRYCDVRWYTDEGEVDILVLHGKNMMTQLVEQEGDERVLSYREIQQDTIRYDPQSGRLKTSAQYAPKKKKKLALLFAEHLLGRPDFFDGEDSQNLYTLRPINERGVAFQFQTDWDEELERLRIIEVQVDEGEFEIPGRKRYPRWAMTGRDHHNAVARLVEIAPELDLPAVRINYLKVEFTFRLGNKSRRIVVKIKPPGLLSFRRDAFEARIMEHLRRNGLHLPRRPGTAAAAAE
jgi:hypothetical protein